MRYVRIALLTNVALLFLCLTYGVAADRKEVIATVDKDGIQRVEIVSGSYFFTPNYIVVKVNVPVEIKIRKEGGIIPHNFVIKAQDAGIDVNVDLGTEPKTVNFTPVKIGSYPFYCEKKIIFMKSHREKGMEGVLVVRQ